MGRHIVSVGRLTITDVLIIMIRNSVVALAIYLISRFAPYVASIYFLVYGFVLGMVAVQVTMYYALSITIIGMLEMLVLWLSLRRGPVFIALYVPLAFLEYLMYNHVI